jgi:hypothetical protein
MTSSTARTGRAAALVLGTVLVVLTLAACAASPNEAANQANEAGFWLGLWHGLIAPIAFIVSLFNDSVGIYEVDNTGGWYDFGFLLGVSFFFSGGGAGAGRSGSRRR